jgi:carbamoyltransferase
LGEFLGWLFSRHDAFRGRRIPKSEFVDHHTSHASIACFASGFREAAVLVVDGNGEANSTSIGFWSDGILRFDQSYGISHSLGRFYGYATEHTGLVSYSEGKLMGLAAYGKPRDLRSPFKLTDDGYTVPWAGIDRLPVGELNERLFEQWQQWLVPEFGPPHLPRYGWCSNRGSMVRAHDLPEWAPDLAATTQHALEEALLHLAKVLTRRYETRNLILAGGGRAELLGKRRLAAQRTGRWPVRAYGLPRCRRGDGGGDLDRIPSRSD